MVWKKNISFLLVIVSILMMANGPASGLMGMETDGNDHYGNGSDCINCHDFSDVDPVSDPRSNNLDRKGQVISIAQISEKSEKFFTAASVQYADCILCHNISEPGASKRIDVDAIKQGVHAGLNNGSGTQPLGFDPINEACWACHSDGTQPTVQHDFSTAYSCGNCHNRTASLPFTNSSIIPFITTRKVFEHIQPPYFEQIDSTVNNSNANCEGCHDKSKIAFSDSGLSRAANVSHYASKTELVKPSINCNLCHKNSQNASAYWANMIRHPAGSQENSFCDNCHNTTGAPDFHNQTIVKPNNIHNGFDWQDDDHNEAAPIGSNEGCMSCHGTHNTVYRLCEDCHISNMSGPVPNDFTRSDINETIPMVYAHTIFSDKVDVPNQSTVYSPSTAQKTFSSCYSFNAGTLEGTCHGNSFKNLSASGGYYAFKRISGDTRSTPYHFTQTIDRLPDTNNCVFCHNQTDAVIRKAWGNATQITTGRHSWYTGSNNSKCWGCHVNTGTKPVDFHSDSITAGGGSDCISCHSKDVNITRFARHINLNTSDGDPLNATNSDCWTCHYKKDMNRNNVYLCESCHSNSSGVVNVTDPVLIKADFMHAMTTCKTCHAPSGYHQKGTVGPLGLVENILKKITN